MQTTIKLNTTVEDCNHSLTIEDFCSTAKEVLVTVKKDDDSMHIFIKRDELKKAISMF